MTLRRARPRRDGGRCRRDASTDRRNSVRDAFIDVTLRVADAEHIVAAQIALAGERPAV